MGWLLIRLLVFTLALAVAAMALVSVSFIITEETFSGIIIGIAAVGVVLAFYVIGDAFRRGLTVPRVVFTVLISVVFLSFSWYSMDLKSFDDAKLRLEDLFDSTGSFQESLTALIEKTRIQVAELTDDLSQQIDEAVQEIEENTVGEVTTSTVMVDGGILVGADWQPIILVNSTVATNPTWNELKDFLLDDETDEIRYDLGSFVCVDYAEMVHNNAEAAGIRTALVSIELEGEQYGHALNAFETTDRGLVFIDCTGLSEPPYFNADKIVDLTEGGEYIPEGIFPDLMEGYYWISMGVVADIETVQW